MAIESRRILCLDGWRGLAVLLVLVSHFSPTDSFSGFGVELFFVLSGRLMAAILLDQRQPLSTFARRRAARILPALVVFVLLASLAGIVGNLPIAKIVRSSTAALLFFSNYLLGGNILTVFQHTWSLAVEEHSYMLLAALVVLARRNARWSSSMALGLAVLMMAVAAIRWRLGGTAWLYMHSESRAASILISFAIACHAAELVRALPQVAARWLAPAAFASACTLVALKVPPPVSYTLGTLLLALAVNVVEHSHESVIRLLCDPILRWFGVVSFSIYLWQQPFYEAHATGVSPLVALPIALIFGAASYYLVEVPCRRLFRRNELTDPALT